MKLRQAVVLDATDIRIIEALKQNARISNVKLADLLGLSPAPCLRRVKELERKGIITGYEARFDRSLLGLSVMAFAEIQLKSTAAKAMDDFEKAVAKIPEVTRCYVTSGGWDYLLEVFTTDLASFEQLSNRHLTQLPGVKRVKSRFALRESHADRRPVTGSRDKTEQ